MHIKSFSELPNDESKHVMKIRRYDCSTASHAWLFVACVCAPLGCGTQGVGPAAAPQSIAAHGQEKAALKVFGSVPAFQLTDQTGASFDSQTLTDKVWVANFFFTRCQTTCPRQSQEVKNLHKLNSSNVESVQFVSISVQPEFDTHEVLRQYANRFEADATRWHFLTGGRAEIWELSQKGFFLPVGEAPASEDMPIFHSSKLILVDREMHIRGFYDSQSPEELTDLRTQIIALLD
jgi:protein SCO1/2